MPIPAGARLGVFEVLAPLGAGGMGEVYRARDTRLEREVALKVLPADVASDPERLVRFEREARTVAALNHPNIVVIHSIEDADGTRFLTMELIDGQSLDRHVAPGGLPVERLIELGIPIAEALTAAHEKGVVHRDLKPANVMLTRNGRVKVLDFGLAKVALAGSALGTSQAATMATPISLQGYFVGTVPYMAPEQIRGEPADARSDLFALGIILYELATGTRPFGGATPADVTSSILRDAPAALASVRAGLPEDLERIVGRCLEKRPRERYQTALEVLNDLRRLKQALERGERVAVARPAPAAVPSIAVLPFVNRSPDAADEYFSDGLADELLSVLGKIRGLRVAARTSAFQFKGRHEDAAVVGQRLNVGTLLEGSVRKSGNRVRISVQLVNLEDGFHLWAETYDRTLDDIFAVQDDIAQSVVKALRTTLLGEPPDSLMSGEARADVAVAAKGRGTDPEAHRLYLQGRFLVERMTEAELPRGIERLRQALRVDPAHALAWACLSRALSSQAAFVFAPVSECVPQAREAARRALALEPALAEAHLALGTIQVWHDWDWRSADASLRRALELAPGNADVLRMAGLLDHILCRFDEAITLCWRAIEQDPLNATGYVNLSRACIAAGQVANGEVALRRAQEISPEAVTIRFLLAMNLLAQDRLEESLAEAEREPARWARLCALAIVHHRRGQAAESERALRELIEIGTGNSDVQIALVYAARGEVDAAFEWLERAYATRDAGIVMAPSARLFASLHADRRWPELLRKLGFGDRVEPA